MQSIWKKGENGAAGKETNNASKEYEHRHDRKRPKEQNIDAFETETTTRTTKIDERSIRKRNMDTILMPSMQMKTFFVPTP
mmetsp:Transcript_2369/g.4358  ORF Transcript_2369/g.4358 Transcript_2369/m.4358 type:complete len:81 (+) Transcript_2369:194-436(+)